MADPVEPVDLTGDPDAAAAYLDQLDRDMRQSVDPLADAINDLAERVEDMEDDQAAAIAVRQRESRLWTVMAAGAIAALGLFLLAERMRRAAP
jgi:hypothetical protein